MNNYFKKKVNSIYLTINSFRGSSLIFKISHRVIRPIVNKYFDAVYNYNGIKLWLNPTNYIDSLLIKGLDHDIEVLELIQKNIIEKEDVFIDIGANFGLFSLIAGKRGTVYSFEPSQRENLKLYKNILLNKGVLNIFPFPFAVGNIDASGKLFLGAESNTGTNSLVTDNGYGFIEIKFINLSSILNDDVINKIRLIKIDVEGFEPDVVNSIYELLLKINNCTLIVEISKNCGLNKIEKMYKIFKKLGFTAQKGSYTALEQYNEIFSK